MEEDNSSREEDDKTNSTNVSLVEEVTHFLRTMLPAMLVRLDKLEGMVVEALHDKISDNSGLPTVTSAEINYRIAQFEGKTKDEYPSDFIFTYEHTLNKVVEENQHFDLIECRLITYILYSQSGD